MGRVTPPMSGHALDLLRFSLRTWKRQTAHALGFLSSDDDPIKGVFDLYRNWWTTAASFCEVAVHGCFGPTDLLESNEKSEAAGPALFQKHNGPVSDLEVTKLQHVTAPDEVPKANIKLRKLSSGRLMVSLIDIREITKHLEPGRYEGAIKMIAGPQIAGIVLEHRRLGNGNEIVIGPGVP